MLRIGLTGGIGCGKSTVAGLFAEKGAPVIDADLIARELVDPGQPALAAIAQAFGDAVLQQGRLNRAALRDRIYRSPENRRTLEAILHPLVFQAMDERVARLDAGYCILAIPLLLETGRLDFVDRILVVDCMPAQQYERVGQRDGWDKPTIAGIIQAQASRAQKLAAADDIIRNDGVLEQLREQVDRLHQAYREMARRAKGIEPLL